MPPALSRETNTSPENKLEITLFGQIYNGLISHMKSRPLGPGVTKLLHNSSKYSRILAVGYQPKVADYQVPGLFLINQEWEEQNKYGPLSGICIGTVGPIWYPHVAQHGYAYRLDFRNTASDLYFPGYISWAKPYDLQTSVDGIDSIYLARDLSITQVCGGDLFNLDFINQIGTENLFNILQNLEKQPF